VHIAAYKCDPEIVQYLLTHGGDVSSVDAAGNSAIKLADKGGRRKSREIMEEHAEKVQERVRRASREIHGADASAPAAAPPAAKGAGGRRNSRDRLPALTAADLGEQFTAPVTDGSNS